MKKYLRINILKYLMEKEHTLDPGGTKLLHKEKNGKN